MASSMVWRPLKRPEVGGLDSISRLLHAEEWQDPSLFTSLRFGPTLFVASDYGGEHPTSGHRSLSFLIADLMFLRFWDQKRSEIRRSILKDSRRMGYKSLGDRRRARALVPLLRAADTIPGLLATFVIDKRIRTLFRESPDGPGCHLVARETWRTGSFEKLLQIGYLGALLVSGLCSPDQHVLWITDQDEIVSNITKHREATVVIGNCLNHLVNHQMGHFRFGTTQSDTGRRDLEDLASLPDLAAGSLADVASFMAPRGGFPPKGYLRKPDDATPQKAIAILGWLSKRIHTLKRIVICIEFVPPDGYKSKILRMSPVPSISNARNSGPYT